MDGALVGQDCNVCDGAFIEDGSVVGNRVTIKNQVMIYSGVTIEDDVFLGPGAIFTNDLNPRAFIHKDLGDLLPTRVERGATVGAGSVIVCGVTIGQYAFVGAGTVVTRDVPAHAFVIGNPARAIGWACRCGARLLTDLSCRCGLRWQLTARGLTPKTETVNMNGESA
jgi:acetyltransferase-like isoleucine patch superfamily enzyme